MSVEELDLAGKTIRKRHVIRVQTSYVGGACLPPAATATPTTSAAAISRAMRPNVT